MADSTLTATKEKPQTGGFATTQPGPASLMTTSGSSEFTTTSSTAVGSSSDGKPVVPRVLKVYENWYPGDATKEGRPAWWNRAFCCGYGIGCLLCPCGSWTCKQERM